MKERTLVIFFLAFFIFFSSWILVYRLGFNRLTIQSEDTLPALFLPVTIIKDHTLYLDKYYRMMVLKYPQPDDKQYLKGYTPYYLKKVAGHYVSAFPIVTAVVSLPVYYFPLKLGMAVTWENLIFLSKISSMLIVSAAGAVLYLLLRKQFSLDENKSLLLTTVYLFGTVNFAMISQSMWQHGTLQLFSLLGLYYILEFLKEPKFKAVSAFLGGLFFGLAILSRPTAALAFLFILLLMFIKIGNFKNYVKANFFVLLGLLVNVLFFLWYNNKYYLGIQNQGYSSQLFINWFSAFPASFLGVWFSPSKGILVYSPIFFFSFVGLYIALKKGLKENSQYLIYFLIILFHTLIISFWNQWYGGYSFGYRMSSDVIPYLILLLVPFVNSELFEKYIVLFIFSFVFSILVQVFGMVFFDGIWHAAYDKGYRDTSWLWSIKDSEFMFTVRRIMVKLKMIQRACPQCL